jgi:hypothetical protein
LCAFEDKELEVFGVVVDGHAPLAIVILKHQRIVNADPGTAALFGIVGHSVPAVLYPEVYRHFRVKSFNAKGAKKNAKVATALLRAEMVQRRWVRAEGAGGG